MRVRRIILMLILCAIVMSVLPSCCPATQNVTPTPTSTSTSYVESKGEDWLAKAKTWFTEVAWSAAGVPIIGPLVRGILGEIAPDDQWVVGAAIIFLILSALGDGGGAAASQRRE